MGIGIIFVVVFVYIVARAILRDNNNKRGTGGRYRNNSADSFFFTGTGADLTADGSRRHHSGDPHPDGNSGTGDHNPNSHGGWDGGGHHGGGHDSGGGGGDSGGGGGD